MKVQTINAEAFRNACFFSMTFRRPGVSVKIRDFTKLDEYFKLWEAEDAEDKRNGRIPSETELQSVDGSPALAKAGKNGAAVKATKRILVPKPKTQEDQAPDPYESISGFMGATKDALCGRFGKALPSNIKEGLFVVSKDLVQEFEDRLNAARTELHRTYIPAMRADYESAQGRARNNRLKQGGLGPLYDSRDYDSADKFCGSFDIEWQWLALGIPEDLPAALRAEAAEKLERQFTEAAEEVKQALRESFAELISHATEKLKPAEAGEKAPTFRDSLIGNIQAFIDSFQARNLMGDAELEALVSQAKGILVGLEPNRIRKYASVREQTREQFAGIQTQLDAMITQGPTRKFSLED